MRLPIRLVVILALAAPSLAAQQMSALAASRFETFARSVDSAGKIATSMQIAAADRERATRETSKILFLSAMASQFGRRSNLLSAVSAVGVSQLFGSLRGDGQMAGFAGLTGGASWLLSTLVPHAPLHFRNVRIAR
jgi:hypothetical protein